MRDFTKGTEGPWEAVEIKEGVWHILPVDRTAGRVPIAILDHGRDGHEPTRNVVCPADARKIAATPDLLGALTSLANEVSGWLGLEPIGLASIMGNTNVAVLRYQMEKARTVIATATSSPVVVKTGGGE